MTVWQKRLRRATVQMLLMAALASCQTTRPTAGVAIDADPVADWVCLVFLPVTWSRKDSQETIQQIRAHNAVWQSLCEKPE